jgi:hypothetical protein
MNSSRYCKVVCMEGLKKSTENRQFPDRDFNLESPERCADTALTDGGSGLFRDTNQAFV